ncbi:hypothetical protein [Brachybacterium sp. GCM10030268]|uniref:hypothetical protein n=1 Tax=Brachybacterium sp. GCM10030268 TaxID=3273382 RepID=UPI00366CB8EF
MSLACSGGDSGEARSISGTQNIIDGESSTLTNQFLLTAKKDGERKCNVLISSPNESAAAVGTTLDADVQWEETPVGQDAKAFSSDERLPMVVSNRARLAAFRGTLKVPKAGDETLKILSTLHFTTCTIVNGSREGGEPLCIPSETDEGGSSFDVDLRVDVLDSEGRVCESLDVFTESTHVDKKTHHQLLSFVKKNQLPAPLCGRTLEFVLAVSNSGPAPLVVHGSSSSFIVVASST